MAALPAYPRSWTVDEYLTMERDSPCRHEYVHGHVYALAGGTRAHIVIMLNMATLLRQVVPRDRCTVFTSDIKVHVGPEIYFYPDVSVSCDPADQRDRIVSLTAPQLVVEVLSDSTTTYGRGDKFTLYQQHAALQDYLLVETRWQAVEVRSRVAGGDWTSRVYIAGETAVLPSLDATLPVAAVYEDVDVPAIEPAD
ncbi:MAG: Uma2 family endonuclease [Chloroflexi bacterium]|nr:Uma2 family endonuclease [Chloroflexota bacterium]